MSQENVETVRRWVDAYNRRDFEGIIGLTDPGSEFQSRFVAIESVFPPTKASLTPTSRRSTMPTITSR
jgi:hypothetical protein